MTPTIENAGTTPIAPAPPPSPIPSAPSDREHEFGGAESVIIGGLGSKMTRVGAFMVGIGICFAFSSIQRWSRVHEMDVGLIFLTLLFMIFGIWTHRAGREFRRVSTTRGRDVSHLLTAVLSLLRMYTFVYVVVFIGLIFALIQLAAENLGG